MREVEGGSGLCLRQECREMGQVWETVDGTLIGETAGPGRACQEGYFRSSVEVRRDALPQVRSCLGGSINTETDWHGERGWRV